MKLYIAARYARRNEMKALMSRLKEYGVQVTSQWLFEDLPLDTSLRDTTPSFCRKTATEDLRDIDLADTMVFFAEDPDTYAPRGGRHVEFGYALARGKRLIVIGGSENIFHFLSGVVHFPDVESFIESEIVDVA